MLNRRASKFARILDDFDFRLHSAWDRSSGSTPGAMDVYLIGPRHRLVGGLTLICSGCVWTPPPTNGRIGGRGDDGSWKGLKILTSTPYHIVTRPFPTRRCTCHFFLLVMLLASSTTTVRVIVARTHKRKSILLATLRTEILRGSSGIHQPSSDLCRKVYLEFSP